MKTVGDEKSFGDTASAAQCRRVHRLLDSLGNLAVPMCENSDDGDLFVDSRNGLLNELREAIDLLHSMAIAGPGRSCSCSSRKPQATVSSGADAEQLAMYRAKVASLGAEVERLRRITSEGKLTSTPTPTPTTTGGDPFLRFKSLQPVCGGDLLPAGSTAPDYKAMLATKVIERTFDDHKTMLRNRLTETTAQLEHFRSGAFYKAQTAAVADLTARLAASESVIADLKQQLIESMTARMTERATRGVCTTTTTTDSLRKEAATVGGSAQRSANSSIGPPSVIAAVSAMNLLAAIRCTSHVWQTMELLEQAHEAKLQLISSALSDANGVRPPRLVPSPPIWLRCGGGSESSSGEQRRQDAPSSLQRPLPNHSSLPRCRGKNELGTEGEVELLQRVVARGDDGGAAATSNHGAGGTVCGSSLTAAAALLADASLSAAIPPLLLAEPAPTRRGPSTNLSVLHHRRLPL